MAMCQLTRRTHHTSADLADPRMDLDAFGAGFQHRAGRSLCTNLVDVTSRRSRFDPVRRSTARVVTRPSLPRLEKLGDFVMIPPGHAAEMVIGALLVPTGLAVCCRPGPCSR